MAGVAFFTFHVWYLTKGRFDYGYNMKVNVAVGKYFRATDIILIHSPHLDLMFLDKNVQIDSRYKHGLILNPSNFPFILPSK